MNNIKAHGIKKILIGQQYLIKLLVIVFLLVFYAYSSSEILIYTSHWESSFWGWESAILYLNPDATLYRELHFPYPFLGSILINFVNMTNGDGQGLLRSEFLVVQFSYVLAFLFSYFLGKTIFRDNKLALTLALAGFFISQKIVNPLAYNSLSVCFTLAALSLLLYSLRSPKQYWSYILLGFSLSLAVLAKQSIGLGAVLGVLALWFLFLICKDRDKGLGLALALCSSLVSILCVSLALAATDYIDFNNFWYDVFIDSGEQKENVIRSALIYPVRWLLYFKFSIHGVGLVLVAVLFGLRKHRCIVYRQITPVIQILFLSILGITILSLYSSILLEEWGDILVKINSVFDLNSIRRAFFFSFDFISLIVLIKYATSLLLNFKNGRPPLSDINLLIFSGLIISYPAAALFSASSVTASIGDYPGPLMLMGVVIIFNFTNKDTWSRILLYLSILTIIPLSTYQLALTKHDYHKYPNKLVDQGYLKGVRIPENEYHKAIEKFKSKYIEGVESPTIVIFPDDPALHAYIGAQRVNTLKAANLFLDTFPSNLLENDLSAFVKQQPDYVLVLKTPDWIKWHKRWIRTQDPAAFRFYESAKPIISNNYEKSSLLKLSKRVVYQVYIRKS